MTRFILFSVFLCLNSLSLIAQTVQQRLDSLFQSLNQDGELSGAFLVVDSGKVVFEKYLGFETAEKTKKISSNSRFELASVSKPFTAMAIMQLEEKGKLFYDDDITKYLPGLKFKNVRIKNLLRHTSGIPEFLISNPKWVDTKKINTNQDLLKIIETKMDSTSFNPGDQYAYSNTNYLLLALIVEKVSGQSFASYMWQHIFKPAGMKNTSIFSARSPNADLKNYAKGIAFDVKTNSFKDVDNIAIYQYATYFDGISGPYGISSTAQDLFRWSQAIQNNTLLKRNNFIKAISVDTLNNGVPIQSEPNFYYGFGWVFMDSTYNENKMHFHNGSYPGYRSIIVHDFKHQRYFVALMNNWNTIDPFSLILAISAGIQNKSIPKMEREKLIGAISLTTAQTNRLVGTYEFNQMPEVKYKITVDKLGNVFAQYADQPAYQVYAKGELELFYTIITAELKFSKENDQITALTLYQNGQELKFNKVK